MSASIDTTIADLRATITIQAEEIARLREALRKIDDEWIEFMAEENDKWSDGYEYGLGCAARNARAALEQSK